MERIPPKDPYMDFVFLYKKCGIKIQPAILDL